SSKKRHRDENDPSSRSKKRHRQEPQAPSSASTSQQNSSHADARSLYHLQTLSLYLPVPPIASAYPAEGLCAEFLSPLLLTYYPPLDGIVLSYTNARLSEHPDPAAGNRTAGSGPVLAKAVDSFAVAFVWLTADFVLCRPQKNDTIRAFVHFQSQAQISLVFLNLISVTIRSAHLPRSWKWVRDEGMGGGAEDYEQGKKERRKKEADGSQGYFVKEDGEKVEGFIDARIIDFEIVTTKTEKRGGLLKIEATLVSDEEA
ncbi:uncharacterized protein BDZ99DRAFT_344387, partial [Mytilinidion resinicola]